MDGPRTHTLLQLTVTAAGPMNTPRTSKKKLTSKAAARAAKEKAKRDMHRFKELAGTRWPIYEDTKTRAKGGAVSAKMQLAKEIRYRQEQLCHARMYHRQLDCNCPSIHSSIRSPCKKQINLG